MARIAIIKLFYGMTITGAQLAGELITHGHQPKVIFFKRQEILKVNDSRQPDYQMGDVPMQNYTINKNGSSLTETSVWKKTKLQELQHLVTMIKEFGADAIAISTLSHSMTVAGEVTEHLCKHFDVPILWGGTGPTIEPERSIRFADLVCVGEGEEIIVEIANRLDNKVSLGGISGTWFKSASGEIQKNPKRPVSNLEKISPPNWDEKYYAFINGPKFLRIFKPNTFLEDKSYQIMTQRGCPFSCSFCVESFYQNEFGKKESLRRMSPGKAIRELMTAKDNGYTTVTFMDDVFTVNPRWLEEFLTLYTKEIRLPFFCYTYPTTHNPKILAMLEKAGCHAITMGVQSGSQRILTDIYNRPPKINRVVQAAKEISESGIPAATFDLIPQTEFDTEEDLKKTFDVLLEIPKDIDSTFYGKMAYFPNYPIQDKFNNPQLLAIAEKLSEDVYLYYFKLYDLTRSNMSNDRIRDIANDPKYRKDHNLLNPFLSNADDIKPSYGNLIELGILRRQQNQIARNNLTS